MLQTVRNHYNYTINYKHNVIYRIVGSIYLLFIEYLTLPITDNEMSCMVDSNISTFHFACVLVIRSEIIVRTYM